ncbi:MAG: DegT/DnrJ/EryC1/StrS family aminotransferase [Vicinamibacteria bacterium]|jgi:dTDP-4-amino-4,6-dideoxygalactose transaminase|nr:DegT/DnrJ/EryC1/StrS family aminotransferase [Vicinamibacteria bacterium]
MTSDNQTLRPVPLLDLKRIDADLSARLQAAFARVLASGQFIMGPEVASLEKEMAEYCGVKHAIGISSGTDALLVALMALNVGPGDEVICPTYTFFATAGAVHRLGAVPVFVDCSPDTYNVEAQHIADAFTARTKAVIPVHLFGQCAELDPIMELARAKGVAVIEDAAQAVGSEYQGRRAGSIGDLGCFSFFPSKNLGALGDAGLVTTNRDDLADQVRLLRTHGSKPKYYHRVVGGNFRIDALQAALIREKLPLLDGWTAARQRNAALYRERLTASGAVSRGLGLPLEAPARRHIYNQFVLRVPNGRRDALQKFLSEHKIGSEVYYPVPMHEQECFAKLPKRSLPNAEAAARATLAIPIFPELMADEIESVVAAITRFFGA